MEGASACPFVAFGDDREGRSNSPDHRHRCFAETPPAPRAAAHQEAYCLSSAFPVCPTFQDWARREAAHARGGGVPAETAPTAAAYDDQPSAEPMVEDPGPDDGPLEPQDDPPVRRNPPRDWAAPPPWATDQTSAGSSRPAVGSAAAAAAAVRAPRGGDRPKEAQGLAGSSADRLAAGLPLAVAAESEPVEELAGLAKSRLAAAPVVPSAPPTRPPQQRSTSSSGRQPTVSSTRPSGPTIPGPAWEHMRRYEAYPTIKTRAGMPAIPRIAVLAGAVVVAALILFMLPAFLGVGGGDPGGASPTASPAAETPVPTPTVPPEPTPVVYVVKSGDSLGKIANRYDLTVEQIMAANPEIKNPNKISVGQEIVIPVPEPS
jgi:LysM repeat protein